MPFQLFAAFLWPNIAKYNMAALPRHRDLTMGITVQEMLHLSFSKFVEFWTNLRRGCLCTIWIDSNQRDGPVIKSTFNHPKMFF